MKTSTKVIIGFVIILGAIAAYKYYTKKEEPVSPTDADKKPDLPKKQTEGKKEEKKSAHKK